MWRLPEQWLTGNSRIRFATWAIAMLIIMLASAAVMIRPALQALANARTERIAFTRTLIAEQRKCRALDAQLIEKQQTLPEWQARAFSAMDISALPGMSLAKWQPEATQSELALHTQWRHIPALFEALSHTDVAMSAFSIQPEAGALRLTLRLEAGHEK